jgi:hypothetical protein
MWDTLYSFAGELFTLSFLFAYGVYSINIRIYSILTTSDLSST